MIASVLAARCDKMYGWRAEFIAIICQSEHGTLEKVFRNVPKCSTGSECRVRGGNSVGRSSLWLGSGRKTKRRRRWVRVEPRASASVRRRVVPVPEGRGQTKIG